jgi:PAS domain S-box-containing protein
MSVFALSSLVASLATIFLGAFVLFKEPRGPLHRVFFLFCLAVAYVGFAEYELRTAETAAEAFRWVKASCAWPLAPAAFFHFAFLYTRRTARRRNGWAVPLVYGVALAASVLFGATDAVVNGAHREYWGWTATPVHGGLSMAVMASITLIGLVPVYLCIRHVRRLQSPGEKKQAETVALGYLVPALVFILTEIVGPVFAPRLPEVTTLGSLLGALIIWFGIRRYKLFVLPPQTVAELDRVNQRLQQEIAEHVRATAALAASEERFRSLFENSTMGLYRTTPEGRILLANPTLIRMLGYESFEELGRRNLEEDGFEASSPRSDFKERIEQEGEIRGLESAWKRPDGTTVFIRESARMIRDAAGHPLYYEGTVEDISEQHRVQEALKASLREKEVLLREIHHRVKNNMQIISSLLSLQAREIADPAVVTKFRESQSRIRSMAFVHERLYHSSDLSQVTFSDYIRSLTNHLSKTYLLDGERIRIEAEIEDIALDIGTAIPCGLIINELVTNSIKHAFPDERVGTIRIELRRAPGEQFMLRVVDDGVGFPAGLDFQLTESLGMQIVLTLVDQIEGAIEREPGPGTSFRIDFGEVKYKTRY